MTLARRAPRSAFGIERSERFGQLSLLARTRIDGGTVIADFGRSARVSAASRYTVQISETEHAELDPAFLRYVNHTCDPNVCFDVMRMTVLALGPVDAGEDLVFFYPSTEWSLVEPFTCACGAARCLGRIAGAASVGREVLDRYSLAPHIRRLAGLDTDEPRPPR